MNVVFHIDEPAKWPLTIQNALNLLEFYRERGVNSRVEIVANSQAVSELTQNIQTYADALAALAEQSVVLAACGNAMRNLGIEPGQLYPFVTVVPAGVAELAERQREGYAYIRP